MKRNEKRGVQQWLLQKKIIVVFGFTWSEKMKGDNFKKVDSVVKYTQGEIRKGLAFIFYLLV